MRAEISSRYYEMLLRKSLIRCKEPFEKLVSLSQHYFQGIGFLPPVYAFIIPSRNLSRDDRQSWIYVIYTKIPEGRSLYVSDRLFYDFDSCQRQATYYLKYFPLYAFLSRNKLECRSF